MHGVVGSEQQVRFREVLHVHEGIGSDEPRLDTCAVGPHRAVRRERPGRSRKPGFTGRLARLLREDIRHRCHTDAILAGLRSEHARRAMTVRIVLALLVPFGEGFGCRLKQLCKA